MAKADEKKAPATNGAKKLDLNNVINVYMHEHLGPAVGIPIVLVVVILLLFVVRFPYQAQETYIETQTVEEPVTETITDPDPVDQKVCTDTETPYEIVDHQTYRKPYGKDEFRCYGEFKVRNQGTESGKWVFRYIFEIGGQSIITPDREEEVPKYSAYTYEFVTPCDADVSVDGNYEVVSVPVQSDCKIEKVYPERTVTRIKQVTKETEKTRVITKTENLFQKIFGLNSAEKV